MRIIGGWLTRLLTHDFFPGVNPWVYWIKRPIFALGVALAIALICAVFVSPVALVSCAAILLVIGLGYGWPQ
ncbi:MAG: DUF58 domain-containing protein, partial [Planctomycetia bacterium]